MSLISKSDVEDELQISLPDGYTDALIASIADTAEDWLCVRTNRTSFTGSASSLATKCVLYRTIDRLITTNPDLVQSSIKKITENGDSIEFTDGGRSLKDYAAEADEIMQQLKLRSSGTRYNYTNESTFY